MKILTPEDKKNFANEANNVLDHPIAKDVIDEFKDNLKRNPDVKPDSGLWNYGLMKILTHVSQIARAQALGIDPEQLRMSEEEQAAWCELLAQTASDAGKDVFVVTPPSED